MRMPFAPVTILPGSAPLAGSRAGVDGCMKCLRSCLNSCASWVIWVISFSLGYKPRRCLATPGSVLPASSADKTKSYADCKDAHRRPQMVGPCIDPDRRRISHASQAPVAIAGKPQQVATLVSGSPRLPRQKYLVSTKGAKPSAPPSRPRPDAFMPPNGMAAPVNLTPL